MPCMNTAAAVGSPAWYDREIDWLAARPNIEGCRARVLHLVEARNAVARRYGSPERTIPTWVSWETMVAGVIGLRRLLCRA